MQCIRRPVPIVCVLGVHRDERKAHSAGDRGKPGHPQCAHGQLAILRQQHLNQIHRMSLSRALQGSEAKRAGENRKIQIAARTGVMTRDSAKLRKNPRCERRPRMATTEHR
jgi:hypothetical protein